MTQRARVTDCAVILLAVAGLHLAVVHYYPAIYGGDTIIRLLNYSRILISYQLPLFQVLIHFTMHWFFYPTGIWVLMGAISGIGALGLYQLTWSFTQDRRAACLAAMFYAMHPFILLYSLVPYQEPLLLAALVWGFYFLFLPASFFNLVCSGIFFGMACLNRYEGWIGAGVAVSYWIWRQKKEGRGLEWRGILQAVPFFGWAPVTWIVYNRGLSPAGTFVVDLEFQWARFYRPYFIAKSALWWTDSALVLMALFGFAALWAVSQSGSNRAMHSTTLIFILLFHAAMTFSGHGIEPDPLRFVTEREAYVPIAFLLLYAACGASLLVAEVERRLAGFPKLGRAVPFLALVFLALHGLNRGITRVAAANSDPEVKTAYEVAEFLRTKQLGAVVLAKPLPQEQIERYLRQAEKTGGPQGREKAKLLLRKMEMTPFDYQRVVAYSWLPRRYLLTSDLLRDLDRSGIEKFLHSRGVGYLVVFSDFTPVEEHEKILLSLYSEAKTPEVEFRNGNKAARIYRVFFNHPL